MTYWALSALLNAVSATIFGLFVYLSNRNNAANKMWGLFSAAIAFWSYSYFLWQVSRDSASALFWCRSLMAGAILIPVLFFHFLLLWLDKYQGKKTLLYACYLVSLIALGLNFTPLYVKEVYPISYFSFWPKAGAAYLSHLIFWAWLVIYCWFIMFQSMKDASPSKKNQIMYVLVAAIIGFGGGFTNYPLWFGIKIPPYGNILTSVYVGLMGYAIVRHQLMDIEVVIKKTLVFAALFAVALGIFAGITLLTQEIFVSGRLIGLAISTIIIIFGVRPLENFLIRVTDKYLFQKKYDYKQVLRSFIDEVITVLNLDRIITSTIELLDKTLHPDRAVILLLNQYEDKYLSYRTGAGNPEIALDKKSKIATILRAVGEIVSVRDIKSATDKESELVDEMKNLGAELAIPLLLHNDMIGIMLLGKKKSDEDYSKEDMDILTDLARTEAIAIGNAQLFAETAQNERRAAIGTLAAGINHEIGNPLNIIGTKIQIFLMSLDQGLHKDKRPEDIINEAKEVMKTCLQQTNRISDITKKLSNFAKPSKEFVAEYTNIEEEIDETLAVVGHELELGRISIKKDIQKSLPAIMADKRQIQQIFFNLIKNAGQAIKEMGAIGIKAYASTDGNIQNVTVEISDTGHGIPEDKLEKIYDPFFTTKGPEKGTGLGLSIVRQLVWRNRGDIRVRSKVGEGTTFTLTFPEAGQAKNG